MTALRGGRSWGSKLHWQPVRLWYMIALTISRIWYLPWWPLTEGCAAFHAVITGSIRAHRSSDKSVAYGLRSLTRLSQHVHAHQPGITLQIHSITVRHHGHRLTDRPLRLGCSLASSSSTTSTLPVLRVVSTGPAKESHVLAPVDS